MKSYKKIGLAVAFCAVALLQVGCGINPTKWVKNIEPSITTVNGDNLVTVKLTLDTGSILLPSFDFTLWHPSNPNASYGTFSFTDGLGGTDVELVVNASTIANLPKALGTLPNGDIIPVKDDNNPVPTVTLKAGQTNINIYVLFDDGKALVGFAIPIAQLDKVGNFLGDLSFFPGYKFNNGIIGTAGLFTSSLAGQSGIGVFADLSEVLQLPSNKGPGFNNLEISNNELSKAQKKTLLKTIKEFDKNNLRLTLP